MYDDPVATYLPELASYPGITVRNLLKHTGGLPDYYDVIDTSQGWPTNADAKVLLGKMAKPVFAPGSRYEYSNPGYDMLAEIVEAASGQNFAAFMQQRIFAPLPAISSPASTSTASRTSTLPRWTGVSRSRPARMSASRPRRSACMQCHPALSTPADRNVRLV